MITFLNPQALADRAVGAGVRAGFTGIGLCESDVLCLDDTSGDLFVLDHEIEDRVLCDVAKDQESFLRAAELLEEHFAQCAARAEYRADKRAAASVALACARAAGGNLYASFYHMMVGA